ncbi:MAG: hypothetical protein ACIAZJ_08380, partial [Gimesia chilikensis]
MKIIRLPTPPENLPTEPPALPAEQTPLDPRLPNRKLLPLWLAREAGRRPPAQSPPVPHIHLNL